MKIDARKRGEVTILEPKGKLLIGEGDVALREAVDAAVTAGDVKLLLDLGAVTRMDSSGMAELIAAFTKVRESGGALKLVNLPPKIQSILGITQLMTVFDIFEEEDEAVASFD